jgi:hypothetical protein
MEALIFRFIISFFGHLLWVGGFKGGREDAIPGLQELQDSKEEGRKGGRD